ncbi:hypothetical protein LshimejAT787_0603650 [Lyophyllum shimeji]|uniref:Uncharacterized protein n=1 Tax=Lyophyllum shimeji TaxID=47721 RepID=A0A9P3UN15_LYOSH|nr:hypothetical protein LshimejAT787_0603650 [Lyophyllum shimeji]
MLHDVGVALCVVNGFEAVLQKGTNISIRLMISAQRDNLTTLRASTGEDTLDVWFRPADDQNMQRELMFVHKIDEVCEESCLIVITCTFVHAIDDDQEWPPESESHGSKRPGYQIFDLDGRAGTVYKKWIVRDHLRDLIAQIGHQHG